MRGLYVGYQLPSTVALIDCGTCGTSHPDTRRHCADCARPSKFTNPATGLCLTCRKEPT